MLRRACVRSNGPQDSNVCRLRARLKSRRRWCGGHTRMRCAHPRAYFGKLASLYACRQDHLFWYACSMRTAEAGANKMGTTTAFCTTCFDCVRVHDSYVAVMPVHTARDAVRILLSRYFGDAGPGQVASPGRSSPTAGVDIRDTDVWSLYECETGGAAVRAIDHDEVLVEVRLRLARARGQQDLRAGYYWMGAGGGRRDSAVRRSVSFAALYLNTASAASGTVCFARGACRERVRRCEIGNMGGWTRAAVRASCQRRVDRACRV